VYHEHFREYARMHVVCFPQCRRIGDFFVCFWILCGLRSLGRKPPTLAKAIEIAQSPIYFPGRTAFDALQWLEETIANNPASLPPSAEVHSTSPCRWSPHAVLWHLLLKGEHLDERRLPSLGSLGTLLFETLGNMAHDGATCIKMATISYCRNSRNLVNRNAM
jgi:hypothetical protein